MIHTRSYYPYLWASSLTYKMHNKLNFKEFSNYSQWMSALESFWKCSSVVWMRSERFVSPFCQFSISPKHLQPKQQQWKSYIKASKHVFKASVNKAKSLLLSINHTAWAWYPTRVVCAVHWSLVLSRFRFLPKYLLLWYSLLSRRQTWLV